MTISGLEKVLERIRRERFFEQPQGTNNIPLSKIPIHDKKTLFEKHDLNPRQEYYASIRTAMEIKDESWHPVTIGTEIVFWLWEPFRRDFRGYLRGD